MSIRTELEDKLRGLSDVTVELWRDSDLMCVFYRGKEFAHFHDAEEIDVRLSQSFIKKEGLIPLNDSKYHLTRTKKSRWMQMRFSTQKEADDLFDLMCRLLEVEYKNTDWGK